LSEDTKNIKDTFFIQHARSNSTNLELREAEFNCKYLELVYLIDLALFILKKKILGLVFRCTYFDKCMIPNIWNFGAV
jgi:hypothetical protein